MPYRTHLRFYGIFCYIFYVSRRSIKRNGSYGVLGFSGEVILGSRSMVIFMVRLIIFTLESLSMVLSVVLGGFL